MANRPRGTFDASFSLEPKIASELDARKLCPTYADLVLSGTWEDADGNSFIPKGFTTAVYDDIDTTKNGVYFLKDLPFSNVANWEKVGGQNNVGMYSQGFSKDDIVLNKITISHNLKSENILFGVYDNENKFILPNEVSIIDGNSIEVDLTDFFETMTGQYKIVINGGLASSGGSGSSSTISVKTETETEYILTITNGSESFDTPNLQGQDAVASGYTKIEADETFVTNEKFDEIVGVPLLGDYTRIGSIKKATNDVWFDSGAKVTANNFYVNAKYSFQFPSVTAVSSSPNTIFAASPAWDGDYFACHNLGTGAGGSIVTFGNNGTYAIIYRENSLEASNLTVENVTFNQGTINGVDYTSPNSATPFNSDLSLYLFAHNRNGVASFISEDWATLDYFEVVGQRKLIAVSLNKDVVANPEVAGSTDGVAGEVGFWCLLNNCFFGNKGTGTPIGLNFDGSEYIYTPSLVLFDTVIKTVEGINERADVLEQKTYALENKFLPRPENGVIHFYVDVDVAIADNESITLDTQDSETLASDLGILYLPKNYSVAGKPVNLVISCHGYGTTFTEATTTWIQVDGFLSQGFAVLTMFMQPVDVDTDGHYGAQYSISSNMKGYKFATDNYNISKNGCFVTGNSMGGLTSFSLVQNNNLPVLAHASFCPVLDYYKQCWNNNFGTSPALSREYISNLFGFTGAEPTFTSGKNASDEENDYFKANASKWIGYSPMHRGITNMSDSIYATIPASSSDTASIAQENNEYVAFNKIHPVPLKIWHNVNDPTVDIRYSQYYIDMVNRAGGLAHLRKFPSGGHNAWENGVNVTIESVDGAMVTMPSSVYEVTLWFKRFV